MTIQIYNPEGTARRGQLVKEYPFQEGMLGTFFTVRLQKTRGADKRVNLYFIPSGGGEKITGNQTWKKIFSLNACTIVGSGAFASFSNFMCFSFGTQMTEEEADKAVEELVDWNLRRRDFIQKYRNGQICYTEEAIKQAKSKGYTVFVKSNFGAGGYYEKPEEVRRAKN